MAYDDDPTLEAGAVTAPPPVPPVALSGVPAPAPDRLTQEVSWNPNRPYDRTWQRGGDTPVGTSVAEENRPVSEELTSIARGDYDAIRRQYDAAQTASGVKTPESYEDYRRRWSDTGAAPQQALDPNKPTPSPTAPDMGSAPAAGHGGPDALDDIPKPQAPITPQIQPSKKRYETLEKQNPEMHGMVTRAATEAGIDPVGFANLVFIESRWNPNTSDSPKGAVGLAQVLPDTARDVDPTGHLNIRDPQDNLRLGAMYLRQMMDRYGENTASAYAAYFAGPDNVDKIYNLTPEQQRKEYPHVLNYVQQMTGDRLNGVARPGAGSAEDVRGGSKSLENTHAVLQARSAAWLASLTPEQRSKIQIISAHRTVEQQQDIYNRSDQTGRTAATPGNSAHNFGLGLDIKGMDDDAQAKLRNFGLAQNVPGDPMHVEPMEVPSGATNPAAARAQAFRDLASGQMAFRDITGVDVTNAPAPEGSGSSQPPAAPAPGPQYGSRPSDGSTRAGPEHTLTGPANVDFPAVVHRTAQGGPDAGYAALNQMTPRGMESSDKLRALQTAAVLAASGKGPQAMREALEFSTMFAQQGAFQHVRKASIANAMGDYAGVAREVGIAYNQFFPDGSQVRFSPTKTGVVGERFDPRSGQRIGEVFNVDETALRRLGTITSDPAVYNKALHEQQEEISREKQLIESKRQHDVTATETKRSHLANEQNAAGSLAETTRQHTETLAETKQRNADLAQEAVNKAAEERQKAADQAQKDANSAKQVEEQHKIDRERIAAQNAENEAKRQATEAEHQRQAVEHRLTQEAAARSHELAQQKQSGELIAQTLLNKGAEYTGLEPREKAAVSGLMQGLVRQQGNTMDPEQAFQFARGLVGGDFVAQRDPSKPDFATIFEKDSKTPRAYLPINVLQQAGMWSADPRAPAGTGGQFQPVPFGSVGGRGPGMTSGALSGAGSVLRNALPMSPENAMRALQGVP